MKNKIKVILLIIIIILLIPIVIATYEDTPIKLKINDEIVTIYKDTDELSLTTFSSNKPLIITKVKSHVTVIVEDTKLNKELNLGLQPIDKNNKIKIILKNITGKKREITFYTLPKTFPEINTEGESKYVGEYYLTTKKEQQTVFNYMFNLDYKGNITYYKQSNKLIKYYEKHTNINNEIRYTYLEKNNTLYNLIIEDINHKTIDMITNVDNNKYIYLNDHDYIVYRESSIKRILYNKVVWKIDNLDIMTYNKENIIAYKNNKLKKINIETGEQTNIKTSFKIKDLKAIEYQKDNIYIVYNNNKILKTKLKSNKLVDSKKYNKKDVIDIKTVDKENNTYLLNYTNQNTKHYQIEETNLKTNKIYFKITIKDNIITNVNKIK